MVNVVLCDHDHHFQDQTLSCLRICHIKKCAGSGCLRQILTSHQKLTGHQKVNQSPKLIGQQKGNGSLEVNWSPKS